MIPRKDVDMGRVKEFALWIAECVYQRQMSDEAIVESVNLVNPYEQYDDINCWLRKQIQVVRNNPQLYEPSSEDDSSTGGKNQK